MRNFIENIRSFLFKLILTKGEYAMMAMFFATK